MNNNEYRGYADLLDFYRKKRKEIKRGVSLKLEQKKYLFLQFSNPNTGKRTSRRCNCDFTELGILTAVAKGNKVAEKLASTVLASEFWTWYESEIEEKNSIVADVRSYREIFSEIEDEFWNSRNKQTKRKRDKSIPSDVSTFNDYYRRRFNLFRKLDKTPSWSDFELVLSNYETGTKSFKDTYFILKNVAKRCHNSDELLKQLSKVKYEQTIQMERQSISLPEYLKWRNEATDYALAMKNEKHKRSRLSWLWVSDMIVLYGLRPSEIAAVANLTEPFTKDGVTIKAINDKNNHDLLLVLNDFTFFGTSIKTGGRICKPITTDENLINLFHVRHPLLPSYTAKPGTSEKIICNSFNNHHRNRLIAMKCPVTQIYAFRHLYNQLGEQSCSK